ncbi:MAG: SOS response-associated peptidase [Parvularcula sp.]|jgi:putative SOS response-associated peptidase YedK|nr:SOS response-associated peptidase [Parvularcula sp.]
MNARYVFKASPWELGEHFDLAITDNFPLRYNIAPSQPVSVILGEGGARRYDILRWGFVPGWDKEGKFLKRPVVNIRSESAHEKPMFRHAFRRRHCLFPMNGFYEWREENGVKQPYLLTRGEDLPLFAIAGLYEDWLGEDGSELRTAAFLTREAGPATAAIHDRQPVYVAPKDYDRWLLVDELDLEPAFAVLREPAAKFMFWAVDRKVGSWKAEGEQLIRPSGGGELVCEDAPSSPPGPLQESLL